MQHKSKTICDLLNTRKFACLNQQKKDKPWFATCYRTHT